MTKEKRGLRQKVNQRELPQAKADTPTRRWGGGWDKEELIRG